MYKGLFLLGTHATLHFLLRPPNNIVYLPSNLVNLRFPVQINSDLRISLNEAFQLFLETVVLIIEVSHMLVKCVYFPFQLKLIVYHLIRMLLKSIKFIEYCLLILILLA